MSNSVKTVILSKDKWENKGIEETAEKQNTIYILTSLLAEIIQNTKL